MTASRSLGCSAYRSWCPRLEITIRPDCRGRGLVAALLARTRDDGLPVDPWLRVHVRAGGQIRNIAPTSMTIPGTLAQWREWTGLAFDASGSVHVPGALVPVMCAAEHDYGMYVEPNVWVHHRLAG
jgi:hypothetical protein